MTESARPLKSPTIDRAACSHCGRHADVKADLLAAASAALHDLDRALGSEREGETAVQKQLRAAIRMAIGQEG